MTQLRLLPQSLFVAVILACTRWSGAALTYTVTDLGTLGGANSSANAINNNGQVVGGASLANGNTHAFLYQGGPLIDLGILFTGHMSVAQGISSNGLITGFSRVDIAITDQHAFRYDGTMHDLGTLGGTDAIGNGINSSGVVAGESNLAGDNVARAFLYDTSMHDLGTLPGGTSSAAFAINDSGQVAGFSDVAVFDPNTQTTVIMQHAFLYSGGVMHDLGTLGGSFNSAGFGINSAGHVVGFASSNGTASHAFLYDGTMHDLGVLAGRDSFARAVNNFDQVVGDAFLADNITDRAVIFSGGHAIDLNTLIPANSGWVLREALGINDSGQIVGFGVIGGDTRAFLLTPVPEPAGLLMLPLCALAALRKFRIAEHP